MRYMILLLGLFLALPVQAAELPRVLILPFDNASGLSRHDALRDGAADMLSACFSRQSDTVEVVDRTALEAVIDEQGLSREGLTKSDFARLTGHLSGADYILRGSISQEPPGLMARAFLHEVATTRLVFSSEASGNGQSLAEALCHGIADATAEFLGSGSALRPALADDQTPELSQLLIVGMGHYYNGNYAEAMPAFMKILRQNPRDGEAQFWLARSFYGAELTEFAEVEIRKFLEEFADHDKKDEALILLGEIESKHNE